MYRIIIHILDTVNRPETGKTILVNCEKTMVFDSPIDASWEDGRVCDNCLMIHRARRGLRYVDAKTFALIEKVK